MDVLSELIGTSAAMVRLRELVQRLVQQRAAVGWAPPILIVGESGVGKNLLAGAIHRAGARATGPFVEVNCAAIPETLLESELFGFEPGAFTDARRSKAGLIEAADQGTLFLNETVLLPSSLQAKLLTFLDDRSVRRLGSTRSKVVDISLIGATNAEIEPLVRDGRFREDLYYRLAALTVKVPPLRERGDDALELAERFLARACAAAGVTPKTLTADARQAITGYAWPGNVRELRNVIERVVTLHHATEIAAVDLDLPATRPEGRASAAGSRGRSRDQGVRRDDRQELMEALDETGWNISHAAARLGLSRNTVRHRIALHNLSPGVAVAPKPREEAGPACPAEGRALPRPLTSFVGREREIGEVQRLVQATRLVTLTGAGGVGKTRLALETATRLRTEVADGIRYVDLTPLGEASLVPSFVCSALGLTVPINRPAADAIAQAIGDGQPLLVLDNCEHLAEACRALVTALLERCRNLRVLVTSRQMLGVAGEMTFLVPSLAVPPPDRPAHVDEMLGYEAIRLFLDRAATSRPGFTLTEQNALAVAQVCHRLDGIPFALELAAARLAILSPEQINARLLDRFRLLTASRPTAPPRQQTLRATMDWSHDLLSTPQRVLLRRLAIFAGSICLEAVESVCGGEGLSEDEVLHVLGELVDRSLVVVEGAESPRYRLLETVRLYALEKLQEADEELALRRRHRDWCLAYAQDIERGFVEGQRIHELVVRTELEYANIRAALAWQEAGREGELARLRLANAVRRYWSAQGQRVEGLDWLERILADTSDTPSAERAESLNVLGFIAAQHGLVKLAWTRIEQGLVMRRAIGDRRGVAGSLTNLGTLALDLGRPQVAIDLLQEALSTLGEEPFGAGLALVELAHARLLTADRDAAAADAASALRVARAGPHVWCIGRALNAQGQIAHAGGDWVAAARLYEEAIALFRAMNDLFNTSLILNHLGEVARLRGDLSAAERASAESLALQRAFNDGRNIGSSLINLGLVALRRDDRERARALLDESLTVYQDNENPVLLARTLEALAAVAVVERHGERAARLYGAAERVRRDIGAPRQAGTFAEYEVVDAERTELEAARFAVALEIGAGLTRDEALREARGA